jgi:hypothetical protein
MTKNQKIWFAVFLAMFLVPEILWSPIGNFYYELLQTTKSGGTYPIRENFLTNSDNVDFLRFILLLQFIGALITLLIAFVSKLNKFAKYFIVILLFVIFLVVGFALYFSVSFNPQIG